MYRRERMEDEQDGERVGRPTAGVLLCPDSRQTDNIGRCRNEWDVEVFPTESLVHRRQQKRMERNKQDREMKSSNQRKMEGIEKKHLALVWYERSVHGR